MSNPTPNAVYIDMVRSELTQSYRQDIKGFITNKYPWIPVDAQTGLYPVFDKNDMLRDEMQAMPPGSPAAKSGWKLSTSGFTCIPYGLDKLIDRQTRANAKSKGGFVDLDMATQQYLAEKYLIRSDKQWASDIFQANIWGGGSGNDYTVPNLWSDQTNGDPLADVYAMKETLATSIGRLPNWMVIGWQVKRQLAQHPEIKDQFKFTTAESLTDDMLARYFEVDTFNVVSSISATNIEGGTKTNAFIVGKNAWLGLVAPNAGWGIPSAFYTLYWEEMTDGLPGITAGVRQWWDNDTESDVYRLETAFTNVVTAADAGVYAPSVVA